MKKTALYISAILVFAACNNTGEKTSTSDNASGTAATEETKTIAGKIDPVCEMERDTSWTEYTVYNNDTVKFCSEVCKGAFLKNPEKYAAKLH